MHYYSIDKETRKTITVIMATIALAAPALINELRDFFGIFPKGGFTISSGTIFAFEYFLFDRFVWKWIGFITAIPNLNGRWKATGISSYKDENNQNVNFEIRFKIRQTFNKIEVFGESKDSTTRSNMASFSLQHAVPIFRYSYDNTPKNLADDELQRHPGLIELRIDSNKLMSGDYFSGKHRLRYGELKFEKET